MMTWVMIVVIFGTGVLIVTLAVVLIKEAVRLAHEYLRSL